MTIAGRSAKSQSKDRPGGETVRDRSQADEATPNPGTADPVIDPTARPLGGKVEGEGFQDMTVGEFCDLDETAMRIIDLKIGLGRAIRRHRTARKLTQAALAQILGVEQPRVVLLESGKPTVSLDALLPAFFKAGGTGAELSQISQATDKSTDR